MTPQEILNPLRPVRIGEFVAEPGLNRLVADGSGRVVALEPKVLEVLLLLARRQGETVGQEEILAAVWEGKFVVDAVVTRAISELRRALGDDSKAPRYIQTVARRGYRLIAPVAEVPESSGTHREEPVALAAAPTEVSRFGARRRRAILLAVLLVALASAALVRWTTLRPAASHAASVPPEAFRLYAQAQKALAGGSCVARQAVADLERAIELAPSFTAAWEQLGWAKYNLVSSCGESGSAYSEAIRAAKRALELDPASTQALALEVAVLTETGRAEEALALADAHAGDSPQLTFLAGYAATYAGDLEGARERIEEVARRDATFFAREGWTPNALLYLGDPGRFLALVPESATPLLRFYRGYALWRADRPGDAVRELGPAFREQPSDPFARLAEALVAEIEGRDVEARLLLGQLALQRTRLAASDGELTFRIAELLAAAGDRAAALGEAERALAQGFFCARCFSAAPAFAALADDVRFRALLADARERERAFLARPARTAPPGHS